MRWHRIAWRDLGAARRSHKLYGTLVFFGLVCGLFGYVMQVSPDKGPQAEVFDLFLGVLFLTVLISLGLSFDSIVGLRITGGLKFLLSLPYSRRDIVIGTFLGRVVTVSAGIASGLLAFTAISYHRGIRIDGSLLLGTFFLLSVAAIVFVSLSLAISMSVRSRTTAGVFALLAFVAFSYAWWYLPDILSLIAPSMSGRYESALLLANPINSVIVVSKVIFGPDAVSGFFFAGQVRVESVVPSVLVLVGYTILPVAGTYLRFGRMDL